MSKTIFERIELEKRGKEPEEVIELNLDNCRGLAEVDNEVRATLNKFDNMESLSLINASLSSVKNFPSLPKLRKLELSDNRVSSGLEHVVKNCPNLTHLSLSGNKIADYEVLKALSTLKNLRSLDLFNCDVTLLDNYREKVFEMLPNLEYLDGYDRDDKEDLEDDEYAEVDGEGDADDAEVEIDEDDDDDDDDLDDEEDELGEEEEDGVGLDYLQKDNLELDSEGEDFNPEEGDEDDDDEDPTLEEADDDDEEQSRGKKRKLEEAPDDGGD